MKMSDILEITDFSPELRDVLPETNRLLKESNLKVHPNVRRITLHGSRGPAGGYRNDSDIDLSVTDIDTKLPEGELSQLLKRVLRTSLENNQCPVEMDMVAIFDHNRCGLSCFDVGTYNELRCKKETKSCMGIYKIQKGFNGFVPPIVQISGVYPLMRIWNR